MLARMPIQVQWRASKQARAPETTSECVEGATEHKQQVVVVSFHLSQREHDHKRQWINLVVASRARSMKMIYLARASTGCRV